MLVLIDLAHIQRVCFHRLSLNVMLEVLGRGCPELMDVSEVGNGHSGVPQKSLVCVKDVACRRLHVVGHDITDY